MKKLRKWFIRILSTLLVLLSILGIFVLKPSLLYAHKTKFETFTVYHQRPLSRQVESLLNNAKVILKKSEIYNNAFKIDICLNDGSYYPKLIQAMHDPAFGIGFYNKVVLMGKIDFDKNFVELNGYKWNLTQLIAHEAIHCYQFKKFGLWKSNPVAGYAQWKWEGYNEYVARQENDQLALAQNIERLVEAEKKDKNVWAIFFTDSTIAGKLYYKWWLQMQYCKDVKGMTYPAILKDTTNGENIHTEMMTWYSKRNNY